jgi:GTP cyclohydrolase II
MVQASGTAIGTFEAYARLGIRDDQRSYGEVAAILRLLGVRAPLCLLSNNPDKVVALRAAGAGVDCVEPLQVDASAYSQHYLGAKSRAGHLLASTAGVDPATPPEAVEVADPEPVPGASRFVRVAAYLLPVRSVATVWFRLHVYLDTIARRERVVLAYGKNGAEVLVRLQREALLDRFGLRSPRFRQRWDAAVERIVAHGRGVVLFADADDDVARGLDRGVVGPLLAVHVAGRRALPLVLDPAEAADEDLLRAELARVGVRP